MLSATELLDAVKRVGRPSFKYVFTIEVDRVSGLPPKCFGSTSLAVQVRPRLSTSAFSR